MAFWGCSFTFNGIPCEDYELMMYDIEGISTDTGKFSPVSIVESVTSARWKPIFYGTQTKEKLKFPIVFGINERRIDQHRYLSRPEIEEVASWLMGHQEYMWLEINQGDMECVRYRCIVTGLELIEFGNVPTAFKATFTCDSPYAYMYPCTHEFVVTNTANGKVFNKSSIHGYYKPKVEIDLASDKSFLIINESDGSLATKFTNLPSGINKIFIDNENGILSSDVPNINLYPYFNFHFFRLLKGMNNLKFQGNGTVKITCEYPVNIGG